LLGGDGALRQTGAVFWSEYEAASRVVRRWPPAGDLPAVLHEPLLQTPPDSPKRQNTDPWVFGDRHARSRLWFGSRKPSSPRALTDAGFCPGPLQWQRASR
jgi:hypothetical protein